MQPFVSSFVVFALALPTVLARPGSLQRRQYFPDDGTDPSPDLPVGGSDSPFGGLDPVTDPSSLSSASDLSTQSDTPISSENPGGPIIFPSSTPSPTSSPLAPSPYWNPTGSWNHQPAHSIPLAPGPVIPSRSAIPSKPVATICPVLSTPSATSGYNATSAIFKRQDVIVTPTSNLTTANTLIPATFTVNGTDGCQTLYTPATATPTCSTTLRGMGQLPITVTNCSQYVTFSTSTGAPASAVSGAPMGDKVAYFLAPWQVIANGSVPSQVTVKDCVDGQGGETCSTSTESWVVVTKTKEAPFTTSIQYSGTITGPADLTLASSLFTTSIPASTTQFVDIDTVITTSTPSAYLSIERMPASMLDDGGVTTVYVQSTVVSTVPVTEATASA